MLASIVWGAGMFGAGFFLWPGVPMIVRLVGSAIGTAMFGGLYFAIDRW